MSKPGPKPTLTPEERARRRQAYHTAWVRQHRASMTPEERQIYLERQREYDRRSRQRKRAEQLTQAPKPPTSVSPTKRCTRCGQEKPREDFFHYNGHIGSMCKECERVRKREYQRKRRSHQREEPDATD